jgi:hypothetical protein
VLQMYDIETLKRYSISTSRSCDGKTFQVFGIAASYNLNASVF